MRTPSQGWVPERDCTASHEFLHDDPTEGGQETNLRDARHRTPNTRRTMNDSKGRPMSRPIAKDDARQQSVRMEVNA